ncbi:MAG: NAD-dependent epimerase/dehydratase family protein [Verrucomicrobiota bacterium JB022]|nr:NAD-dependent epimerase/dehydratase family protein [Verrucomicrobiota bacterium JB022]
MKVLITGGAGFLGRYIVERCLARGYQVVSFQRSDAPDLRAQGVDVRRGSLTDAQAVADAAAGCDAVFHVAALAGIWGPYADYFAANVEGTRHVLGACRAQGARYLVYTSTPSVVFNRQSFAGADESLPYGRDWLSPYAPTKAQAEQEALAAHAPGTLEVCALRPHLIWGVGDPHLLPRVVQRARQGRLRIVGDGQNRVDITRVENAADAHLLALDALQAGRAGGKAYFLSQGEPVALWPWVNEVLQQVGVAPLKRKISLRAAHTIGTVAESIWKTFRLKGEPPMTRFVALELAKDHWYDISAARRDLDYRPENHPTAEGVEHWAEHYRQQAR